MTNILHKNELIHPIFLMILIGLGVFTGLPDFELFEFWKTDPIQLLPFLFRLLILYIILNALNTSQVLALKNGEIIKGIYCLPFGFLKVNESIPISDIKQIQLKQNKKLYYEIIAQTNTNSSLVIKAIANKIPAEKELIRIKTEISAFENTN
ncbi:hypothetical protein [Olleya sp. HaHaR_3_96]|uniref:hypothetical protein n=1 Tax=Olleya sp. HaHaR_3_96 TaxID=2745560 RepID=UPI001C500FE7|nr:hypothetical protein [Olleya sp. HaHaR_3_96]QXP60837.1 hypothetical protein H0I26_04150 [Olleya sp. HaHaR_3_96]